MPCRLQNSYATARISESQLGEHHCFLLCSIARTRNEARTDDSLASAYDGTSLGVSPGLGCDRQARLRDRGGMDSFYPGTHPFGQKTVTQ